MPISEGERPAAVIFDVGGTLLEERWFDLEGALRALIPDAQLARGLSAEFGRVLSEHHRADREIALARWMVERLVASPLTVEELEDALWRNVVELVPRAGVAGVLTRLEADRVAMAAVSNAAFSARVLAAELQRHGLLKYFRFVVSSADFGLRKPHPAIFEAALDRLGVPADRAWFVGDTLGEDIAGAEAAGLRPIWLSDRGEMPVPVAATRVRDWASLGHLYAAARSDSGAG